MNILITGQFDRNSANIAKLCARAFEQGPISFRRVPPPPPPPRARTQLKESVGKDRFGKISPAGVIQANLRNLFRPYLGNIRETSS